MILLHEIDPEPIDSVPTLYRAPVGETAHRLARCCEPLPRSERWLIEHSRAIGRVVWSLLCVGIGYVLAGGLR